MVKESTSVRLPTQLVKKVEQAVDTSNGLYDSVEDYIAHSITFWMRGQP